MPATAPARPGPDGPARPRPRLVRRHAGAVPGPELDAGQSRVVAHEGGPLLVLAGPGTGKTTTLVEAIVDRVARRGAAPESVLALTFSRKAAEQLRDRVTARLGRTTATATSLTFHSFAYGLVRRYAPPELYTAPLRLLSAPEQDVVLQELLTDAPESVSWPESLRLSVGTRGFAREVQAVLARAREKGLEAGDLARLGAEHALPELTAAGLFLEQYLQVLDTVGALDYADLVRRAVIEAEVHREELRERFRHVFVDEYQDTDPGQVALLEALAGDGRDLVVVGDPHQSIYGFRGAEVRAILEFPTCFPRVDGTPAPVVALRTTRRFGPALLEASQRVAARIGLPGSIGTAARDSFRSPVAPIGRHGEGVVEVVTFDTERAEAEHLGDLLRRAHLEDGVGWSEMAVLVRSGRSTLPGLRRALGAAGVPVEVASDDTPLVREPAVRPLLEALHAALHHDVADPAHPDYVHPDQVAGLLASPLADLDATGVRTLARVLRAREPKGSHAVRPRPSAELLREAVLEPTRLRDVEGPEAAAALALGTLVRRAHDLVLAGATAEEALWALWSGTGWPRRLQERAEAGGPGARLAHRDLDAVVALFETAARTEERRGHTGVAAFLAMLAAQRIPADTLAERGVRGQAVRLLTAHRAKGLEWRLVVVAHVQEETWPDLRRRASLLHADRLAADGLRDPVTVRALLAEERRLFYVGCTRARERLVVTAVASPEDDGEQPSRFLADLGVDVVHRAGRPARPLSLQGLVAELRRAVADPATAGAVREAAAVRLARLAGEQHAGRALVPAADPATWWGTRGHSVADQPLRPAGEPVAVSASTLAGMVECPGRWFLAREAGGAVRTSQAQGFGNVVHALADRVARGELPAAAERVPETVTALMRQVDAVWERLSFRTPWSGDRERMAIEAALERFLRWHLREGGRRVVATERELRAVVPLPDGQEVRLVGYADRLEVGADGRVVVVDLKTGKYPPPERAVADDPQLGLYQLAVEHGAADEVVGGHAEPGGAELWQLRHQARGGSLKVQTQPPQAADETGVRPVEHQLMEAVTRLRQEQLEMRPGEHCQRCEFVTLCPTQTSGTVLS